MKKEPEHTLLKKYLTGQCTPEEAEYVRHWLNTKESTMDLKNQIEKVWAEPPVEYPELNSETLFNKILSATRPQHTKNIPVHTQHQSLFHKYVQLVAVLLILLMAGLGYYTLKEGFPEAREERKVMVQFSTQVGEKKRLTLSDGSKVVLNAGSTLKFYQHFSDSLREVQLEGEAFFEVAKDPCRPFIVKANAVFTKVLGTRFNVSAYPEEDKIRVALAEGKVQVNLTDSQTLGLNPGHMATYSKTANAMFRSDFDYKEMLGWKDGILYFKDASFEEIVEKIEKWYAVKVHYNKAQPAKWKYNGEFDNKSLEYVLNSIGFASGFNYKFEKNNVIIY
ncbi:FecR domain-containing protein [Rapidithrix thailandica]|uniref:FecR domain-containing protein n=1 Tax=Rapidithrix thailandica TaxID=413964 RepID=A0AAW9S5U0_9BACT